MSNASNREDGHFYYTPRITFEELVNTSNNILVTTACLGGILNKAKENKELYDRYKLTGKFFKEYSYIDNFGTNKSGGGMAKYILKRALKDKNIKVLFRYPFDMAARFIGMKVGKIK